MLALSVLLVAAAAMTYAEPPVVTGVYFVAPPPPAPTPPRSDLDKATVDVMAQLKQIEGADSGEYHVYLPDGRLQKVTYTTAPLATPGASSAEQLSQYRHRPALPPNQLSFQNNQQVNHQIVTGSNQQNSQSNQVRGRLVTEVHPQLQRQTPSKYVASVSYTDIQPITGPIYAHNDQPLNRVLRYASVYV